MDEFLKIADLSELHDGKGIARKLDADDIALVKLDDGVHAFVNTCPHQHTPLVDKYGGQIAGENLTCPMHGWTYDLKTGKCLNESGRLKKLDVKLEGGSVYVRRMSKDLW